MPREPLVDGERGRGEMLRRKGKPAIRSPSVLRGCDGEKGRSQKEG